jgi:hypothetical protein
VSRTESGIRHWDGSDREYIIEHILFHPRQRRRHDFRVEDVAGFFDPLSRGEKTFEIRRGDRLFSVGDLLRLREWSKHDGYTGREVVRRVTYTLTDPAFLAVGFVAMGLAPEEDWSWMNRALHAEEVIEAVRAVLDDAPLPAPPAETP